MVPLRRSLQPAKRSHPYPVSALRTGGLSYGSAGAAVEQALPQLGRLCGSKPGALADLGVLKCPYGPANVHQPRRRTQFIRRLYACARKYGVARNTVLEAL